MSAPAFSAPSLSAPARALLEAVARDPRARSREALAAFHAEICALDAQAFVELCAQARAAAGAEPDPGPGPDAPPPSDAAPVERSAAYDAADAARKRLLVSASRMVALLTARLEADTGVDFSDLCAADRRSLARFVKAAARRTGAPSVIAAAKAIVAERSLAHDIL